MKLYHYSANKYDKLMTRRVQGNVSQEEIDIETFRAKKIGLPLPYVDNMSFFFERLPLDQLPAVFGNKHTFWKAGVTIFEYEVDLEDIDPESFWRIVETLEIQKFVDQFDWAGTSGHVIHSRWLAAMNKEIENIGYSGYDTGNIFKAAKKAMPMSLLDFYRRAAAIEPDLNKYAANVPHLMIYPKGGIVNYRSVKKVTLGTEKVDPVLFHLTFRKLPNVLIPRQPEDNGDNPDEFLEKLPNRVSFSPTVRQAFAAIYQNVSSFFEDKLDFIEFNVYSPVGCATLPTIPPAEVLSKVWDAHYTGEVCYTGPVRVVNVGVIRIMNPFRNKVNPPMVCIQPFDNKLAKFRPICPETPTIIFKPKTIEDIII